MSRKTKPHFKNDNLEALFHLGIASPVQYPEISLGQDKPYQEISVRSSLGTPGYFSKNVEETTGFVKIDISEEPVSLKRGEISQYNTGNLRLLNEKKKCQFTATSFYAMSEHEIIEKSVCEITNEVIKNETNNSLFDPRLGCSMDTQFKICASCNKDIHGCTGHYGFIRLKKWFPNPLFKTAILYVLRSICHYCGHLYITEEFLQASGLNEVKGIKRLKGIAELSDQLHALHDHPSSNITYSKDYKNGYIITYTRDNIQFQRSIENVDKLFSFLTPIELKILGLDGKSNPRNWILKVLPVCPPQTRPTMYVEGVPKINDITTWYQNIIKKNKQLYSITLVSAGNREHQKSEIESAVYENIDALINGDKNNNTKGEKDSALIPKLGKKDGLLRKHSMGKRVNFSARSVAGPGSEANFGEILIPGIFTNILTVPEKVTKYNYERLTELFKSGQAKGFYSLEAGLEQYITITPENISKHQVVIGDIIVRPITNGDALLVGRQPTLHAESFMGFSTKIHNFMTIGLHSSNNAPFNADFDGDELNMHVIQDIRAQVEALTIANCKYHIMNVQSNKPMMGLAYNGLMSAYLMTMKWVQDQEITIPKQQWEAFKSQGNLTWESFLEYFRIIETEVEIPDHRWEWALSIVVDSDKKTTLQERCLRQNVNPRSGSALFSVVFPTNFNYTYKKEGSRIVYVVDGKERHLEKLVSDDTLIIRNGILVKGILNKDILGTTTGSLVQVLNKMYSFKEADSFINDGQKICDWFIMWHGLSIGFKAIEADRKRIFNLLREKLNETQFEIYNLGPIPKDPIQFFFWNKKAISILSNTEQVGKNIGEKALSLNNPLNIMGELGSKAKGSRLNTAQITGSLSQQFISGALPPLDFNDQTRCLPFFLPNDVAVASRGYIVRSYRDGLTPSDLFFHMMASRVGLIDTASNTAQIGYSSRRIRKGFEDTSIDFTGMVSTIDKRIFSFTFGDCLNPAQQIPTQNKKRGKILNFCDVKAIAEMLNSEYEQNH